jgi:hypothetical protein
VDGRKLLSRPLQHPSQKVDGSASSESADDDDVVDEPSQAELLLVS